MPPQRFNHWPFIIVGEVKAEDFSSFAPRRVVELYDGLPGGFEEAVAHPQ